MNRGTIIPVRMEKSSGIMLVVPAYCLDNVIEREALGGSSWSDPCIVKTAAFPDGLRCPDCISIDEKESTVRCYALFRHLRVSSPGIMVAWDTIGLKKCRRKSES